MGNLGAGILFGLLLVVAAPASAATDKGCRNGLFPKESTDFGLAHIKGTGRAYLLRDSCPDLSSKCEYWGYVLPGDKVVTGGTWDGFVCAYFPSRGGGSAGWVEKSRVQPITVDTAPPPSSWLGRWSDEGNPSVHITRVGGTMHIAGESFWPGKEPAKDWPPGWPHTGAIDGKLILTGNRARYDEGSGDYDCRLELVLVDEFLIARDNGMCGGENVRFDVVYHRGTR